MCVWRDSSWLSIFSQQKYVFSVNPMLFLLYKYSHWKHKTKLLMKMQWYCYSSSKLWNFENKQTRCKRSNTLWSNAFKAFLAKWSRPFKRWTRKRRMGNTVEQNSPKQNISRFPLMETVKMRWLLTHELNCVFTYQCWRDSSLTQSLSQSFHSW